MLSVPRLRSRLPAPRSATSGRCADALGTFVSSPVAEHHQRLRAAPEAGRPRRQDHRVERPVVQPGLRGKGRHDLPRRFLRPDGRLHGRELPRVVRRLPQQVRRVRRRAVLTRGLCRLGRLSGAPFSVPPSARSMKVTLPLAVTVARPAEEHVDEPWVFSTGKAALRGPHRLVMATDDLDLAISTVPSGSTPRWASGTWGVSGCPSTGGRTGPERDLPGS